MQTWLCIGWVRVSPLGTLRQAQRHTKPDNPSSPALSRPCFLWSPFPAPQVRPLVAISWELQDNLWPTEDQLLNCFRDKMIRNISSKHHCCFGILQQDHFEFRIQYSYHAATLKLRCGNYCGRLPTFWAIYTAHLCAMEMYAGQTFSGKDKCHLQPIWRQQGDQGSRSLAFLLLPF